MENNEKILRKLYKEGKREIQPNELSPLNFNFKGLYTSQSVAFGVITYYFWKDVKYGEYLLEKAVKTGQTEDENPKYLIRNIDKEDDSPEESDMNTLKDFLLNSEEGSYETCKRYLNNYPDTLLKFYQINKTQGGKSVGQWISWTELSLGEIDRA